MHLLCQSYFPMHQFIAGLRISRKPIFYFLPLGAASHSLLSPGYATDNKEVKVKVIGLRSSPNLSLPRLQNTNITTHVPTDVQFTLVAILRGPGGPRPAENFLAPSLPQFCSREVYNFEFRINSLLQIVKK